MQSLIKTSSLLLCILSISIITNTTNSFASQTDGTIDPVYKYAWSQNLGWINFGTVEGNVHVLDNKLTGYAWNENTGWVNLNVSTSTYVANNSEGILSGYAWGEGIGYIDFAGVTIDNEGYFHGYASSTLGGQISFNCLNASSCASSDWKTRTDWRKASLRSTTNTSIPTVSVNSGAILYYSTVSDNTNPLTSKIDSIKKSNDNILNSKTPKLACSTYLLKHIKKNGRNDAVEVKKLQTFLSTYEGFKTLKITGVYDEKTISAVHAFQNKYANHILGPWQTASSTGYVYKTTLKKINELYCIYTKHSSLQ